MNPKVKAVNYVVVFSLFLHFFASPVLALNLSQTVNTNVVQTDSPNNTVTYTIQAKNTNACTLPVDTFIVFDKSTTEKQNDNITYSKGIVSSLVNKFNSATDRLGLIFYDDAAKTEVTLTNKYSELHSGLGGVKDSGKANQAEAIKHAKNELLKESGTSSKKLILLLSEGSPDGPNSSIDENEALAIQEADAARALGISVALIQTSRTEGTIDTTYDTRLADPGLYFVNPNASGNQAIYDSLIFNTKAEEKNITVWDNVSSLSQVADFVSASDNGRFENEKVLWTIPSLKCNESKSLSYTFRFRNAQQVNYSRDNSVKANVNSQEITSNVLNIQAFGPWLTASITDNRLEVSNQDEVIYIVTIKNVGTGDAFGVNASVFLAQNINLLSTSINGYQLINKNLSWTINSLSAGQEVSFTINTKLILPELNSVNVINTSLQIVNDNQALTAEDFSTVKYNVIPVPDFSLFVNCVDRNADNTFTAHFGYINRLSTDQILNRSDLNPASVVGNPPTTLLVGRVDKAFTATAETGTNIVWTAGAEDKIKVSTASSLYTSCTPVDENPDDETPEDSETPEDPQDEEVVPPEVLAQADSDNVISENMQFNLTTSQFTTTCDTRGFSVSNTGITSNSPITLAEYSLDNGFTWFPANNVTNLGTNNVSLTIQTRNLQDKLYGVKLRAYTINGNLFVSDNVEYSLQCASDPTILGSYYKNGFGQGLVDANGDFIYNSSLNSEIYVETLGAVSEVYLKLSDNTENLDSTNNIIELNYNYDANLWSTNIPAELLNTSKIYTKIEAVAGEQTINKNIPSIINPDFVNPTESDSSANYSYSIYFYDGVGWDKLDYSSEFNNLSTIDKVQKFTLFPAEYYIEVKYPNGKKYYTDKFKLDEPSIVRVEIKDNDNKIIPNFLDQYFSQIDVEIFAQNDQIAEETNSIEISTQHNSEKYKEVLADYTYKFPDMQILTMYWNRWNPHFNEQLGAILDINNDLNLENRKVVLLTDENNYEELIVNLKLLNSDIDVIKVTDNDFIIQELSYQPEILVFDSKDNKVTKLRGKHSFENLKNTLFDLNFLYVR